MIPDLTPREIGRFCTKIRIGGCGMLWAGPVNNHGYGRFEIYRNGKRIRILAHRLAYKLATGKDPGDDRVRHGCDNPPCVTPACLEPGTQADNVLDAIARGRANFTGLTAQRDHRAAKVLARINAGEKPCSRCKQMKPMSGFALNCRNVDGRAYFCKRCMSTYSGTSERERFAARAAIETAQPEEPAA